MTEIDQFESVFKSADKPVYSLESISIDSVLTVTDLPEDSSTAFAQQCKTFLSVLDKQPSTKWQTISGERFSCVGDLLSLVQEAAPDLICAYRNLHTPATEFPYSLGVYLDVLTQATSVPVLLLPNPQDFMGREGDMQGTRTVMAITDHLTGDHHLVSYGALLTQPEGKLLLTHVEDQVILDRYMSTISKIPSIETESARESILKQLLKEPRDYIRSCKKILHEAKLPITIEEIVTL